MIGILHTYLNESYYADYFAEEFMTTQSERIAELVAENTASSVPILISETQIEETLQKVIKKEDIAQIFNTSFDAIENYENDTIIIDLQYFKEREAELIKRLTEESTKSLPKCAVTDILLGNNHNCIPKGTTLSTIKKEADRFFRHNINFGIPTMIEIEVTNDGVDKSLRITRFIIGNRNLITTALLFVMFLPLIGIFGLNIHPLYKGFRKVSTSLMLGVLAVVPEIAFKASLGTLSDLIDPILGESGLNLSTNQLQSTLQLLFGKILDITTFIGLMTLLVGIFLFGISMLLKRWQ